MSGHARWSRLRTPSPDPSLHREQVAHVRGYLLALEDTLKDLEKLRNTIPNHPGLGDPHRALFRLQDMILTTRRQALHTEKVLLAVYRDKEVPCGKKVQASSDKAEASRSRSKPAQQGDELSGPTQQEAASTRPASKSVFASWKEVYEQEGWKDEQ